MTGRWWRGVCLLVLVASAALVGGKAWMSRQYRVALAAHERSIKERREQREQSQELLWKQSGMPVVSTIRRLQAEAAPFDQFVREFRSLTPAVSDGSNSGKRYQKLTFIEAASATTFEVGFLDNRYFSLTVVPPTPPPEPRFDSAPWAWYGPAAQRAGSVAMVAWVIALAFAISLPRHRRAIALLLLSIAVFATAASSVDAAPGRLLRPDLLDRGVAAPLLIAASAALAAWPARPKPVGRCRACGYDLTGNVSGRCPECGTYDRLNPATSEEIAARIAGVSPSQGERP